jgi:hypothetical protein
MLFDFLRAPLHVFHHFLALVHLPFEASGHSRIV